MRKENIYTVDFQNEVENVKKSLKESNTRYIETTDLIVDTFFTYIVSDFRCYKFIYNEPLKVLYIDEFFSLDIKTMSNMMNELKEVL